MKKNLILLTTLFALGRLSNMVNAQVIANISSINARINATGDLFYDSGKKTGQFEVPKGSSISSIFAANLWIGGIDAGGQLHVATQTCR